MPAGVDMRGGSGEMAELIRTHDWASTPLGPRAAWRQSLRTAVDLMLASGFPVALFVGPQHILLYNDRWVELIAERHPGALGRPTLEAFPELRATLAPSLDRVRRGETIALEERMYPLQRRGRIEETWFAVAFTPLRGDDGHIVGVFVTGLETTERRHRDEHATFLADLGGEFGRLTHPEDIIASVGQQLAAHLQISICNFGDVDDAAGTLTVEHVWSDNTLVREGHTYRLADYLSPQFVEDSRAGRTVVIDDTTTDPRTHGPAHTAIAVGALITVPFLQGGRWTGLLSVADAHPRAWRRDEIALIRDVVSRVFPRLARARAEAREIAAQAHIAIERTRTEEALREADRRKDEFLAMLAHELRNPLTPLRAGLDVLRMASGQPAVVTDVAALMGRQVDHMVRLVDDLLDIARITRGKITLHRRRVPLGEVIDTAIEAHRAALDARRLTLDVRVADRTLHLDVDPTRIVQVISNVLHNASKFTPPGGRIELHVERREGRVTISVRDTGIGIAADALPTIFELFTQDTRRGQASQGGLGLGLALARRLVEMHGGHIGALSAGPGHGTLVTIDIPVTAAPAPAQLPATVAEPIAAGPRRVLIIDDNQDAARALAMLIEVLGGQPTVAHDGETGLARLAEVRPHAVLLDIGLPGLDGYETCRRIRALLGAGVTILAVTGWGQSEDRQRAIDAGFDAHVTKPPDLPRLRSLLRL